jgi:hypothetical protein
MQACPSRRIDAIRWKALIDEGKFVYLVHIDLIGRCGGQRQNTVETTIEEMEQTGTLIAASIDPLTTLRIHEADLGERAGLEPADRFVCYHFESPKISMSCSKFPSIKFTG